MIILILLCTLLKFFAEKKQSSMPNKVFTSWQLFIVFWIIALVTLNVIVLLFKCFMRTISYEIDIDDDLDVFDIAHSLRFMFFALVDFLNGISILYCFYCMAQTS